MNSQLASSKPIADRPAQWRAILLTTFTTIVMAQASGPVATRSYDTLFKPQDQRPLVTEANGLRMELVRTEPCTQCPSVNRFVFRVSSRAGGTVSEFAVSNETAQVDEIRLRGSRLAIIVGRVMSNVSVVTIADHAKGLILDTFYCFDPAISPDGGLIAFVKSYPLHFVAGTSDEYLMYGVDAGPQKNRTLKTSDSVASSVDVGLPFFPPGSDNRPGDNLNVERAQRHALSSNGIFWLDGRRLAFADHWQSRNWLVFVDLRHGPDSPKTVIKPIDTSYVIDAERCATYASHLDHAFQVRQIEDASDRSGALRLTFGSFEPQCLRNGTLVLPIR